MTETTASVVAELNGALGTEYRLVRQLTGGLQSGAYELSNSDTRVVLKWTDDPDWAPRVQRAAELFIEAALRAGGRAATVVCAASAFATIAEFVHDRSKYSQDRVHHGARRVLELLES
jgi:hypothetical protein